MPQPLMIGTSNFLRDVRSHNHAIVSQLLPRRIATPLLPRAFNDRPSRAGEPILAAMPSATELLGALRRYWGYDSFRPMQERIVRSLLGGQDTCVVMPTGGGKSLCYQLPAALLADRTVIVVSPLIALMQDQVAQLTQMGIPAALLNSTHRRSRTVRHRQPGHQRPLPSAVSFPRAPRPRRHHRMAATRSRLVLRD